MLQGTFLLKSKVFHWLISKNDRGRYHTLHLLVGFIGDPTGQLYASENSFELDNGPRTRITPGECTEDRSFERASSGRIDPHQI